MQPDHAPFNPSLLNPITNPNNLSNPSNPGSTGKPGPKVTNGDGQSDSSSCSLSLSNKSSSELKVYIGGIETVPQSVRLSNTVSEGLR